MSKVVKKLSRYDAVIIDDIGYVQHSRQEMEVLFIPGRLLRTRQPDDYQQLAVFQMGADILRSDECGGGY